MEISDLGIQNPAGIAFSPAANAFHVIEARQQTDTSFTDIIKLTPAADRASTARIGAAITDPINMAFDSRYDRLLIFQAEPNQLIEVLADPDGNLVPATLVRHNVRQFGLQKPQGMTVDPATGHLYILDSAGPRIVRIEPQLDGSFDSAVISVVDLTSTDLVDPRGLAFDPTTGHLHVVNPHEQELYELNRTGQLVTTRNLAAFELGDSQGMVFAPSGDMTDDPEELSLYIAGRGLAGVQKNKPGVSPQSGWTVYGSAPGSLLYSSPPLFSSAYSENMVLLGYNSAEASADTTQLSGDVYELSFTVMAAAAGSGFTSSLVNTVDMSLLDPPSPDPSGLAYVETSNHLIMDDGEVEETVSGITHFQGANVWELTLDGAVVSTANISSVPPVVIDITNEPTGIAWNPANGHYFFVQDDGDAVFEMAPGADGQYFTADDVVTSFDLTGQNSDGEGLAFDSWNNHIFVADGVNAEVYEYTLSGSLVSQFDVAQYGVADPESVEFNPYTGTLFVMSSNNSSPVIVETTTSGDLLNTIDISAAGARTAAGLAYAPASDGTGAERFYIVDRGIDNNSDPNIVDGKMYELTAPVPITGPVAPIANDDSASTALDTPVIIDVATNDTDPNGNLDPTTANNTCNPTCTDPSNGTLSNNGDGSFTYTPDAGYSGSDSFIYEICDADSLCDTAAVNVTIGLSTLEVRVAASSDDAEEAASGGMTLGSSDLELVLESSVQTVGMRFNGITIPRGAAIISAYIQFQTDEADSEITDLLIEGEATDNATTFGSTNGNISSRPRTSASATWSPAPWTVVGQAGPDQQTSDISAVIQEIVTRPGWASGNALAIIISGSGKRVAESYNGTQTAAPLLHIEYAPSGNHFPGVNITAPAEGSTFFDGDSIVFSGTASDYEDGDLTATIAWESDLDGPLGTGGSFSRSDLSVGDHTITATVVDNEGETAFDTVTISIFAPGTAVFVGAGDIADCGRTTDDATADLLDNIPGTVYTLGDNVYPNGSEAEYNDCYDPTWGRHKARTIPVSGNHEYDTGTAAPYFNYFGAAAGDPDKGYYSTDLGNWHIIVLNTECSEVGGCGIGDPQGQWLQADLAANPRACTMALMHKPLFSSTTSSSAGQNFWTLLYQAEVDVVLSGHAHNYERFAPQDPTGALDPVNGIREFVVGTGGISHSSFGQQIAPNSVVRDDNSHGVLKLTLNPTSYDWEFIPIPGDTFTDSGSANCVSSSANSAPTAADDDFTGTPVTEGGTLTNLDILINDSDIDGTLDATSVTITGSTNGTATANADGTVDFVHDGSETTTASFTYTVNDNLGATSNEATATLAVTPLNDAPVATGEAYSTDEDTQLNVVVPGVLGNDTDADGDALTAVLDAAPGSGTLALNADGSFDYTPAADFNGSDSFTYHANDGTADSNTTMVNITVNAVNDAPVATGDAYSIDEDTALTIAVPGLLGNDSDTDGDPLTAVLNSGPGNGALSLSADGSFNYTPAADFNGSDSFTYHANDGTADSNTATVTIAVNPVNDTPVAGDDNATTNEDVAVNIVVLTNDTDVDGDNLTIVSATQPANGSAAVEADGTITYTPDVDFNGADSLTYDISDGNGGSDTATVTITVNPVNDAPVAGGDVYSVDEDTTLTVAAPGVLGNDTDTDGDPLTAVLDIGPTNGTLSLNADGSFDYVPDTDINGSDSFTYHANDGTADSNVATVTITVNAVNDAPVASDDSSITDEDVAVNIVVLTNDTDADGDALTAVLDIGPTNGTVTLNADGSFDYTPAANFNGSDSFTYHANDGTADSNVATVTITVNAVNDAPVAGDDSRTTDEDVAVNIVVLTNDTDVDGDSLTVVSATQPANGSVLVEVDNTITYTPDADFNGSDTFTYHANDGTADSNVATVTITVNAVNDAPVASDGAYSTAGDTPLTVPAPGVLGNDSDVDGDPLTAVLEAGPANGALTLNSDGSFSYTPNSSFTGSDTFTYHANDGTSDSNVATVTITVNLVNDPPVAGNDAYPTDEDTALTVTAAGVLNNDTDADGDPLTAVLNSAPANGTLTLNADGSFDYTPNADFNGSDSFTYHANDGTADSNVASVTLTINPVNDVPVAADDAYSIDEDTTLTIAVPGLLGNDTDADGDPLTAVLNSGPGNGTLNLNADGSFDYTPNANFNGTDSFTYHANDGTADSNVATVTITVIPVNDPPVASDGAYSIDEDTTLTITAPGVLANDGDADGDPLMAVLNSGPGNGTLNLNADGSFDYTPNADFNGTDSFTYHANDGTADSNVATVTITVIPVNDPPVASDGAYSTAEDTPLTVAAPGVLGNDSDVDGDPLATVLDAGPANGTLALNSDGSFNYTPNPGFTGIDGFTYTASDGTANSNVATVTITVNLVNDPPVASDDAYVTNEDTLLTVPAAGVLGNDSDADGDALTAALVAGALHGMLTFNGDGSFTYTPNADFNGSDSFTYIANDGIADSNLATVAITVNSINDAPVAADDTYSTFEDTQLNVAAPGVLANDTDVENVPLTAILVTAPGNGSLNFNADGSFTYTPDANFGGTDTFTYRANDGVDNSNLASVSITVEAINDPPVAQDEAYTTDEDTILTVAVPGVLANDTDAEGDPLTAVWVGGALNGTLTLNPDGSFTYAPNADFYGTADFTYRASDGFSTSNLATVTITVNPVNDAPVAIDDAYTMVENTTLTVAAPGVLGSDTDVDGDALTAVLDTGPTNGSLTLNADGSFAYTPDATFNGSVTFTYHANDGSADSNVATVTITVNPVNDAPVANNDAYSSDEDTILNIAAPGLLGNDTDADGDPLTSVLDGAPGNGTLTLNPDGSFTYTPNADFNGSDSFTYVANDGTIDSNVATVRITVNPANDAPTAADDTYSVDEDMVLNVAASGVLSNDTDTENDPLTAILVSDVSNGTLTLNADGSFTYTPNADFNSSDSFTYVANDGTIDSNVATVTITVKPVNDPPTAADDVYTTDEDRSLTMAAPGVLGNDGDVDGDALTAILVSDVSNGTLTLNADGSFTYTPNADFNGSDSFTYVANDGTADSAVATVSITVNPVNDAPVAVDDSASTTETASVTVDVAVNDSDVDGNLDPLSVNINCANGSSGCVGPVSGIVTNNGDSTFTYTPNTGFTGSDGFVYEICDTDLLCATATVNIEVTSSSGVVTSAYSETLLVGSAVGSYLDTIADDGLVAAYTEQHSGGPQNARTDSLLLKTMFNVPCGGSVSFTINAWISTLGDDGEFVFSFSNDDQTYESWFTVSSADPNNYQVEVGPECGTVYVQIEDSTQIPGNYTMDTISIDQMYFTTHEAGNALPSADFTFEVLGNDVAFTDASVDPDGQITSWAWGFGDNSSSTLQNPQHLYSAEGTYTVTLTVTDDQGAVAVATAEVTIFAGGNLNLSVAGYKVQGLQKADLTWTGGSSATVEIYRNGSWIATVPNDGFFTDHINARGSGTYDYQVCEPTGDPTTGAGCSNVVTVSF